MLKMKNLQLTKWLQLIWDALAEQDQVKRNHMLKSADVFLKEGNQQLPVVRRPVYVIRSAA
jgi:hypothetical protein